MKYKFSYYRVITDEPVNDREDYLVYSTRSCKLMQVTKLCLECLLEGNLDYIPATILEKLIQAKLVVDINEDELQTVVSENINDIESDTTLSEIIQPSSNCQLGCYYCGQQHTKHSISGGLALQILERVRNKCQNRKFTTLKIIWFGGEPLMALHQMRFLSLELMKIAAEFDLKYTSTMVSNGLSLKEDIFVELATKLGIRSIDVTLDGLAEYHDQHRYTKENKGTFDIIYNNLKNILNRPDFQTMGCDITIRCNVDEKNHMGIPDFIKFIAEDPIFRKISSFYFACVYSWGGNDAHKKSLEKGQFAKRELFWKIDMIEKGLPNTINLPERKKIVCTAVRKHSAEMIDAYGNVFTCSEVSYSSFYENTPYVLGNINTKSDTEFVNAPLSDWNETLLTDQFPCHKCRLMPVCGGQCPKKWYEDEPACPAFKFNIREKMELVYLLDKQNLLVKDERIIALKNKLAEKEFVAYK